MAHNNLLILCNNYPDKDGRKIGNIFVKEQLKYISKYFLNVYVIVPSPLSISKVRRIPTENYSYGNIHVFFLRYLDFPLSYFLFRDLWVEIERRSVSNFIEDNNLKFDIIHAHNTWRAGRIATRLKETFDVPVVITEHTSNVLYAAVGKKDKQFVKAWNLSDAIIRVNKKDVHLIEIFAMAGSKIKVIPNGYDAELFFPIQTSLAKEKLKLPINKKVILTIGRLDQTKGYPYMLSAVKEMITDNDDFIYIIIGDGKLKHNLESQIKKLGIDNYVKLIGGKPHNEIPLWMNACDLFVLPSLNEGNPTVMFEALGCGKPFVGTRVGGVPEVITSEDYGLLVDPADPEDLAEKVLAALDREWDREKILAYARRYTWENIAKEVVGVYDQVLNLATIK